MPKSVVSISNKKGSSNQYYEIYNYRILHCVDLKVSAFKQK